MKKSKKISILLWFLLGASCLLYYIAGGLYAGFSVSILWIWVVIGMLSILMGILQAVSERFSVAGKVYRLFSIGAILGALLFMLVEIPILGSMGKTGPPDLDYIVILGTSVHGETPSKPLNFRIRTAFEYLQENPRTKAIASGGKGQGENISEAECIAAELKKLGIPSERILLEDRSTTTEENIKFSYQLLEEQAGDSMKNQKTGIVTNNFHLYRSVAIAKKTGFSHVYGISAPFYSLLLPHYATREFAAYLVGLFSGYLSVS